MVCASLLMRLQAQHGEKQSAFGYHNFRVLAVPFTLFSGE
jgi:hypothetical protein